MMAELSRRGGWLLETAQCAAQYQFMGLRVGVPSGTCCI